MFDNINIKGIAVLIPLIVVIISVNYLVSQGLDVPQELLTIATTLSSALIGLVIPLVRDNE